MTNARLQEQAGIVSSPVNTAPAGPGTGAALVPERFGTGAEQAAAAAAAAGSGRDYFLIASSAMSMRTSSPTFGAYLPMLKSVRLTTV